MSPASITFTAVLCLLVGVALIYAAGRRSSTRRLTGRVSELEGQLSKMGESAVPISAAFRALLIKDLTHFHTPEMDELMVKLGPPYDLLDAEADRLSQLLAERSHDLSAMIDDNEREAAVMLPLVINRVRRDLEKSGIGAEPLIRLLVVSDNPKRS